LSFRSHSAVSVSHASCVKTHQNCTISRKRAQLIFGGEGSTPFAEPRNPFNTPNVTSSSAVAERPRCGWVSYGTKWKTVTGRQYFTDIIGLFSTTVTKLASKAIEFGEKCKIKDISSLKVIQGHRGRYQSKVRMRLSN